MDIVTGIIKLLFGSKADKDRKAIEPYVNKIKEVTPPSPHFRTTNSAAGARR